jgi:hypothetical protein
LSTKREKELTQVDKIPPKREIDDLIATLELAKSVGFESTSSPAQFLLDAAIDISLLLGSELEDPQVPEISLNQDLKEQGVESLNNPKLIKVGPRKKPTLWDPLAGRFCKKNLAAFFVVLQKGYRFDQAYHELDLDLYPLEGTRQVVEHLNGKPKIVQEVLNVAPEVVKFFQNSLPAVLGNEAEKIPSYLGKIATLALKTAKGLSEAKSRKEKNSLAAARRIREKHTQNKTP